MTILIYMAIGAILMFLMLGTDKAKDDLATEYIKYRSDEIAAGNDYFDEATFRNVFITILFVMMIFAWPWLVIRRLIKAVLK